MTFTQLHVAISLIGIVSGLVTAAGLLSGKRLNRWTILFLSSTVATSVTGFLFPFHGVTPAIIVGVISLVVLAVAILARYSRRLVGPWRWIYVVSAMIALYLNVFVLIVQLFQNVPALKAMAPTQSEPSFVITHLFALIVFILSTVAAIFRFRVSSVRSS